MADIWIRDLEASDYFGEISMIYDSVRTATVTCSNYVTLGRINVKTLYEICSLYPNFKSALVESTHYYDDPCRIFLNEILRDIPYLRDEDHSVISTIANSMKQDFLEPGALLFQEKDV